MGVFCFTTLLAEIVEIRQAKRLGAEKSLRERLEELKEVIDQVSDTDCSRKSDASFRGR